MTAMQKDGKSNSKCLEGKHGVVFGAGGSAPVVKASDTLEKKLRKTTEQAPF